MRSLLIESIGDRGVCALIFVTGAVMLWARPAHRVALAGWSLLLAIAIGNALVMQLHPENLVGSNMLHYYLGAKYPIAYTDLYRAWKAGLGEPQVSLRDLEQPTRMLRETEPEQRVYYLDLIRARGAEVDPLAPLDQLKSAAIACGAVAAEADSILRATLPANRIEAFRADVRAGAALVRGRPPTHDFGYNGSPFYALVRQADPALHVRLGPWTGVWNAVGLVLVACAIAWLTGSSLGLGVPERIAAATFLLASWDFVGYSLSGLVYGELWLPLAVVAWTVRRERPVLAGITIAWAGLLKLFPFVLALPLAVRALRRRAGDAPGEAHRAAIALAACVIATLVLGSLALLSGRSWAEFLLKIVVQFQSAAVVTTNSVSLGAMLGALSVPLRTPVVIVLAPLALFLLVAMAVSRGPTAKAPAKPTKTDPGEREARRALVLIGATGWWAQNWLNYYTVAPLVLLPAFARRHGLATAVAVSGFGFAFALPDFDDPTLLEQPFLHVLKLAPYLAVPAWMAIREGCVRWTRRRVSVALATGALLVVALTFESWRTREAVRLDRQAREQLQAGSPGVALELVRQRLEVLPAAASTRITEGIALGSLGRLPEARVAFEDAVRLAPDDPAARDNLGRALTMLGRHEEATRELQRALALSPADARIEVALARTLLAQGRREEALVRLRRAREIVPDDQGLAEMLADLERGP